MPPFPISGYVLRLGSPLDRAILVKFMEQNYRELGSAPPAQHLATIIDRYLSRETPLWLVEIPNDRGGMGEIAGLWLGQATDQRTGRLHPYVLLLYVHPDHRRQGIATALLEIAHQWAQTNDYSQVSLQVFSNNPAALALYQKLGYEPEAILMKRRLG
ncbi:MAG: GNAT family N-acetyltransferase [Leptolyngbyaceae cyanobacterium SM2_5_2]|nr:GNAT family N-acetyltransferase [Leptolyngbyaceae cyanobacterium SM2_5_2]